MNKYIKNMKYIKNLPNFLQKNKLLILLILIITIIILLLYLIFNIYMRTRETRVVVFDLDETLGHFVELGVFCDIIEKYKKSKLTTMEFNNIMDLFPVFLRTHMLPILSYLKEKKKKGILNKVYIYTNNNGPKEWAEKIRHYLERKIDYKLFDKIIGAYKVDGKIMEGGRTTHNKTVDDFLSITKLPRHTKICFLDDLYHEEMDTDNVYYLKVKPYHATIPFHVMAEKYYNYNYNSNSNTNSSKTHDDKAAFIKFVVNNMSKYNLDISKDQKNQKNQQDQHQDEDQDEDEKAVSKEIFNGLKNFLKTKPRRKTQSNKSLRNRTSRKIRESASGK